MDTVKDKEGREWHIGCGGQVVRGICVRCGGRKKGLISRIFGEGPLLIREDKAEAKRREHRQRIRERRDIYKE